LAEVFSEKFKSVENHTRAAVIEENPPKLQPKIAAERPPLFPVSFDF
jgi:hypothetical protein